MKLHPGVLHHVVNTLGWPDLRPLQRAAIAPIRRGDDCLLLAPTAGGKTEAAIFPLLSQITEQGWQGLSVLVVTPLRALLNNLQPRLDGYAGWVGCRARVWHGDTPPAERASILRDPPQILLTTPESLEAMLVSTSIDHRAHFAHLRAVVIDELHAFAGDDRGWHLLAVLQRLQHLTGRSLQRIGLTATVGNPDDLLAWLQGGAPARAGVVVAPAAGTPATPEITIDYVGSIANAATVIAALHHGEKRLVFTDSRAQAEQLATALRERGVSTFVSHSSLELGIDVGDLDRVIQLDAPRTVASFLQRLGRTGRRAGTTRNCLFLATSEDALLRAAALTLLWGSGFVEPVIPPVHPRHIAAQQFLALALQEGAFGLQTWRGWWDGLSVMAEGDGILRYLLEAGFLDVDGGMAFIGPQAERHFGRRHFMELLSAFTAEPELTVLFGRNELGSVSPLTITGPLPAGEPRLLVLAGRTWQVTSVDFARRRVQVVEHQGRARSRWTGGMPDVSFALTRACRDVLLGQDPPVELSRRATGTLERIRAERSMQVDTGGLVLHRQGDEQAWWTFAGTRGNASLVAGLARVGISATAAAETVRSEIFEADVIRALSTVLEQAQAAEMPMCEVDQQAVDGLKFSAALPGELAMRTLAERGSDLLHARECTATPVVVRSA